MMLQAAVDMSLILRRQGISSSINPVEIEEAGFYCEILHQLIGLIGGLHMFTPLFTGFQHVSSIQGGAGFLPSTVGSYGIDGP